MSHNIRTMGNPHFSAGQTLPKKKLRKDKYWLNQLRKNFFNGQHLLKIIWRRKNIETIHWEKLSERSAEQK